MNIKLDFVTNSSSSSFIFIKCKNEELSRILEEYQFDLIEDGIMVNIKDNEIEIFGEEACMDIPATKNEIVPALLDFFTYNQFVDCYDDKEKEELLEEYEVASAIYDNKEKIEEAMESATISYATTGWGGDDETRFYKYMYDEDKLQDMLKTIAAQNNCNIEDVTDEMFDEFVMDETSQSETIFNYDKKTGVETVSHTFGLLEF